MRTVPGSGLLVCFLFCLIWLSSSLCLVPFARYLLRPKLLTGSGSTTNGVLGQVSLCLGFPACKMEVTAVPDASGRAECSEQTVKACRAYALCLAKRIVHNY